MKFLSNIIPDKSHTFSKAYHQYPVGYAPEVIKQADGVKVSTDKGVFLDWSMGLGPVIKGYNFKKLNTHIFNRISKGFAFSIPSDYEFQVAEKLLSELSFGDSVRFAKNGSDVTSAAVRLARFYTKKNHVICNGYHGWQDWYIGSTTRRHGVPNDVAELTHKINGFDEVDLENKFKEFGDKTACLILEPMIADQPNITFLNKAKQLCKKYNTLLVFDECWTGFRCHKRGAIGLTKIKPDLSCYAKALGNGVPVSAIVGNKKIMSGFEEVFFSFTHSSDPFGLAAAEFMLDYLDESFFDALSIKTNNLYESIQNEIEKIKVPEYKLNASFYPGKIVISAKNPKFSLNLKTFIQKELLKDKILFNMFFAIAEDHSIRDIDQTILSLKRIIKKLNSQNLDILKETNKILVKPVFRVQS